MTREELHGRCKLLATVGDGQAIATLLLFQELITVTEDRDQLKKAAGSSDTKRLKENFAYVLSRIDQSLQLAIALDLVDNGHMSYPKSPETLNKLVSDKILDDYEKSSIEPQSQGETFFSGAIKSGAKRLVDAATIGPIHTMVMMQAGPTPEELAIAATRKAQGLPDATDPGVFEPYSDSVSSMERGTGV